MPVTTATAHIDTKNTYPQKKSNHIGAEADLEAILYFSSATLPKITFNVNPDLMIDTRQPMGFV